MQSDLLQIEYSTFGGAAFTISLQESVLTYEWFQDGLYASADRHIQITPDSFALQKFWAQIRMIGVWRWREAYEGHALDGEHWLIRLSHEGKQVHTQLVNAYPPKGSQYPSEAFKRFLKAVGELLGDKEFVNYWYHNERGGVDG